MSDSKGFIKIDRKILEWRWASHPITAWTFITLLLMANYQDHDFQNVTIHRGQVATSIGNLAKKTGTSYAQARRTLVNMTSSGELTITRYSKFLVITIVNYDEYQTPSNHLANTCKSFSNHLTIKRQQSKKDNTRKERKERARAREESPSGMINGLPAERDQGTVEDIPEMYRDRFDCYQDYWDWRNQ